MSTFEQEERVFVESAVSALKLGKRRMMKVAGRDVTLPAVRRQLTAERQDQTEYAADDLHHRPSLPIKKTPAHQQIQLEFGKPRR